MYSLTFLNEKQFKKLPYSDVDIALGIADYKKGKAYIRKSGIPAIDMLVAGHELNELLATVSPHDENGIRYKKGSSFVQMIVPAVMGLLTGGIGSLLGLGTTMSGLVGGAGGALSGGLGMGVGGPEHGGIVPALMGGLGGYGAANMLTGGMAGWQTAAKQPGVSLLSKAKGALEGSLFGTQSAITPYAGGGGAATVVRGTGTTGLLGSKTLNTGLAGLLAGNKLASTAGTAVAQQAAQQAMQPQQTTPTYQYVFYDPRTYGNTSGLNNLTGTNQYTPSTAYQTLKPMIPTSGDIPLTTGYSGGETGNENPEDILKRYQLYKYNY